MRSLLTIIVASSLAGPTLAGGAIKITNAPLQIGETGTVQERLKMNVDLLVTSGPGQTMPASLNATREVHRNFEVQAIGPAGPSQVRVTYVLAKSEEEMFGQQRNATLPVQGHTYTLTLNDAGRVSTAADEAGGALEPAVQQFIMGDNFLANANLVLSDARTQSFEPGQDIADFADVGSFMPKMGPNMGKVSAILTGTQKSDRVKVAAVDITMSGTMSEGPMAFEFNGSGEILIHQKRGFVHSFEMDAPISIKTEQPISEDAPLNLEGKGTLSMEIITRLN